jgi:hypothetical protein
LTEGFVEDYCSSGGDVEGADAASHGNAQQVIAGAADKIVKAGAFSAKNENAVAGEIELVVVAGAAFVETDDPEIVALELFKGADEIDDAGDAEVLGSSGAGLDGGGAKWCGPAFGEQDAVDAGAIGDTKKRAEILRVFYAVECEEETSGRFDGGGRGLEEVLESEKFLRADKCNDALVGGGIGGEGKLLARPLKDADACVAALGDEAGEAVVVALTGNENVIEATAPGLESFRDRMQAVENFHEDSLRRETRRAPNVNAAPK